VQALPVVPLIGNLGGLAVDLRRCRAGLSQRVQDGAQLSTDGVAELAFQLPHAIAALPHLQMSAVLLQLLIDWCWAVGVDQRQPVAESLELLPEADLWAAVS
jgi:hypothetical protein